MPKERFHMLLAEESLRFLNAAGRLPALDARLQSAYLLGAIFPDTLFYDLPTFASSSVGNSLHRFQGEAGLEFFIQWFQEEGALFPDEMHAWALGFTGHLLSDGAWHPAIEGVSSRPGGLCGRLGLSRRSCHHWVESELEACWVGRVGARDGYRGLLSLFRREKRFTGRFVAWFRRFLERAGIENIPDEHRIARCLGWQTLLLTRFAERRWSRRRSRLLRRRGTQYLGALIVPEVPELPDYTDECMEDPEGGLRCGGAFLARAVATLAERLSRLPVRF